MSISHYTPLILPLTIQYLQISTKYLSVYLISTYVYIYLVRIYPRSIWNLLHPYYNTSILWYISIHRYILSIQYLSSTSISILTIVKYSQIILKIYRGKLGKFLRYVPDCDYGKSKFISYKQKKSYELKFYLQTGSRHPCRVQTSLVGIVPYWYPSV